MDGQLFVPRALKIVVLFLVSLHLTSAYFKLAGLPTTRRNSVSCSFRNQNKVFHELCTQNNDNSALLLRSFRGGYVRASPPATTTTRLDLLTNEILTNTTSTTPQRLSYFSPGIRLLRRSSRSPPTAADADADADADGDADGSSSLSTKKPAGLLPIFRFAIPAIAVWLCSPVLSLIDTSFVGLLAGTGEQAALSPAVAISDYATLLLR